MKALVTLLVLAIATPALAQTPIKETVIVSTDLAPDRENEYDHAGHHHTRDQVIFWTGISMIALGTLAAIGAVTWAQESDLSEEFKSVHLGRDILPCGTDPENATMPIAECKTNTPLLWIGTGLAAAGGGLVSFAMVTDPHNSAQHAPMLRVRVRF
jgi:hypothetical protein